MTKEHPIENDTKDKTKKLLDKYGWFHFAVPGTRFGSNGTSDRIAVKHGHLLAIENKKGEEANPKGTALQEKFLQKVRDAGGTGWVINLRMARDGELENMLQALESWLV